MIAFVQSQPMGGCAMQGSGPGDGTVVLLNPYKTGVLQHPPGIGLSFEIVKRLYGKENAVYTQ
jgi:hypothetical protein